MPLNYARCVLTVLCASREGLILYRVPKRFLGMRDDLAYLKDRIWDFKAKWGLDSESKIGSLSNNDCEGYQNIT